MNSADEILKNAADSFAAITKISDDVEKAAQMITEALRQGGKVFFCGNGGSAGDAQHLEAEFLGRFLKERQPLPAIPVKLVILQILQFVLHQHTLRVFKRCTLRSVTRFAKLLKTVYLKHDQCR